MHQLRRIVSIAINSWLFSLLFTATIHRSSEASPELCNEANFGQTTNLIKMQVGCSDDPQVLEISENDTELWVELPSCGGYSDVPSGLFTGSPNNNVKKLILSENNTMGVENFVIGVLDGVRHSLVELQIIGLARLQTFAPGALKNLVSINCIYIEGVPRLPPNQLANVFSDTLGSPLNTFVSQKIYHY